MINTEVQALFTLLYRDKGFRKEIKEKKPKLDDFLSNSLSYSESERLRDMLGFSGETPHALAPVVLFQLVMMGVTLTEENWQTISLQNPRVITGMKNLKIREVFNVDSVEKEVDPENLTNIYTNMGSLFFKTQEFITRNEYASEIELVQEKISKDFFAKLSGLTWYRSSLWRLLYTTSDYTHVPEWKILKRVVGNHLLVACGRLGIQVSVDEKYILFSDFKQKEETLQKLSEFMQDELWDLVYPLFGLHIGDFDDTSHSYDRNEESSGKFPKTIEYVPKTISAAVLAVHILNWHEIRFKKAFKYASSVIKGLPYQWYLDSRMKYEVNCGKDPSTYSQAIFKKISDWQMYFPELNIIFDVDNVSMDAIDFVLSAYGAVGDINWMQILKDFYADSKEKKGLFSLVSMRQSLAELKEGNTQYITIKLNTALWTSKSEGKSFIKADKSWFYVQGDPENDELLSPVELIVRFNAVLFSLLEKARTSKHEFSKRAEKIVPELENVLRAKFIPTSTPSTVIL